MRIFGGFGGRAPPAVAEGEFGAARSQSHFFFVSSFFGKGRKGGSEGSGNKVGIHHIIEIDCLLACFLFVVMVNW